MRGKKAAGAAIRKDRADLEARAVRAEHAEQRLTGELAELKERTRREIHALRTALAEAKKQRDDAVNPLLLDAEERIRTLSQQLQDVRAQHAATEDAYRRLCTGIMEGALKDGLTPAEGRRRIANLSGEHFAVRGPEDNTPAAETDPQRAAFEHAMHAKTLNTNRRLLAGGGKIRVDARVTSEPGGEA